MFSIWTALIVLGLVAFSYLGPLTFEAKRKATNNPLYVAVPSQEFYDQFTERKHQNYRPGVLVQERGEWKLCAFLASLLTVITILIFYGISGNSILTSPLMALVEWFVFNGLIRMATNSFDYAGHEAEILKAEEDGLNDFLQKGDLLYRDAEVWRMINWDNRKDMSPDQVKEKLRKWRWLARIIKKLGDQ